MSIDDKDDDKPGAAVGCAMLMGLGVLAGVGVGVMVGMAKAVVWCISELLGIA